MVFGLYAVGGDTIRRACISPRVLHVDPSDWSAKMMASGFRDLRDLTASLGILPPAEGIGEGIWPCFVLYIYDITVWSISFC